MSAYFPSDTKQCEPAPPQRDREDVLRLLRQLMAQSTRVVRLGGRARRAAGDRDAEAGRSGETGGR